MVYQKVQIRCSEMYSVPDDETYWSNVLSTPKKAKVLVLHGKYIHGLKYLDTC